MKANSLICVCLAMTLFLSACAAVPVHTDGERITVVDLHGRKVEVPTSVERVACIGSGALRLYSYVGDMSKLCGVESCEYGFLISHRPYQMVYETLFRSLPSIGAGGPQGAPDAEALIAAKPDIIFSLYTSDDSAMDELQKKTGIPVIVLDYGDTEAFDDSVLASIRLMGEILGRKERAEEVAVFLASLRSDLDNRTKSIPDKDKKTVYLGCQSNYGTHGIGSSTANYSLFDAIHAKNVLDLSGYHGYQKALDMETLLTMDPDVIILDAGGLSNLKEEYQEQRDAFHALSAFKNQEVYLQLPYNAYYTNLEIAYANAYYIGKILYPDAFADIDIEAKLNQITTVLLGKEMYDSLIASLGTGYQRLDISLLS